ncbi:MAG: D-amino acid dehydrogenase [Rhodocyclaceae bacterium]
MNVIVLGAGLAGVASAWYLSRAGHSVSVIERGEGPALETSFANGGQVSVSHPEPWANPRAPRQILRWLGRPDAPLKFRPRADWKQWSWAAAFLRECLPARTRRNTDAIAALALHSRAQLHALREETGIEYEREARGILHLFFEAADFAAAGARARMLRAYGMQARVLDARECMAIEPALAGCRAPLQGGLYAPEDESGDAHLFAERLAALCAGHGVRFLYRTRAIGWDRADGRVCGVRIAEADGRSGLLRADAFLVCLGSYSAQFVEPLGERLPIYPVKGYSVTLPLAPGDLAPRVSITDESRRIVCSRLGAWLRIAGTAELCGYDRDIDRARCEAILARARELFPGVREAGEPQFWAGLRPTTPSNVPIIGRSRVPNVFLNTGHGSLGWTLACGSARAIAEILGGRDPGVAFPFRKA